jgi:hypothetical protein
LHPKEIWKKALADPVGIAVSKPPPELELELQDYRRKTNDPELWGFHVLRKGGEIWIVRAVGKVRVDGDYRPME